MLEQGRTLTEMFGYRTDHPAAWADPKGFMMHNLGVHQAIYDAIRTHDPRAARRAMKIHMRNAPRNCLMRYDWQHRQQTLGEVAAEDFPESRRDDVRDVQKKAFNRNGDGTNFGEIP